MVGLAASPPSESWKYRPRARTLSTQSGDHHCIEASEEQTSFLHPPPPPCRVQRTEGNAMSDHKTMRTQSGSGHSCHLPVTRPGGSALTPWPSQFLLHLLCLELLSVGLPALRFLVLTVGTHRTMVSLLVEKQGQTRGQPVQK